MFCFNCGEKIIDRAKFCPNCGTNLSVVASNAQNTNIEPSDQEANSIKQDFYVRDKENESVYDENDEVCDTDFIIQACNSVNINSPYCEVGQPIAKSLSNKYAYAKINFNIPDNEDVFLIYDSTVLGSCKKGFAICTTGFYYCETKAGYINWEQFRNINISNGFTGLKVGYELFNASTDGKKLFLILKSIQEYLQ